MIMLEQGLHKLGIDTAPLHRFHATRWLLVLFALGAAGLIGLRAPTTFLFGRNGFEVFLLLILLGVAIALVLYRLELGVLAIVLSSFFLRFTFSTGSATSVPVSLLVSSLVVGVWFISMLLRRRVQFDQGIYVLPTILFIAISLFSVPYSWLILRPDLFGHGGAGRSGLGFSFVQVGGVTLMVLLPAVMLLTANVLKSERWFKALFWIVVIVAVPELLMRLEVFNASIAGISLRTGASYALWVVALAAGQGLFNTEMPRWLRAALLGIAGIWLYFGAEVGATWFSGWMPAALALMFLAFMRSRPLFFMLLVLVAIMFSVRADHYIGFIWNDAVNMDSNRFEIWQVIILDLTLTKTNFLFGAGPAGYLPFYERYYPGHAWVSHNNYVDIFAEVGLVGFTVFMWMLVSIFLTGWRQRNAMPTPFLKAFNLSVLGGFLGTCFGMGLGDWHIPFVYNIGIPGFDFAVYGWLLIGAMLALSNFKVPSQRADNAQG